MVPQAALLSTTTQRDRMWEQGPIQRLAETLPRYPARLSKEAFYPIAYRVMYYTRTIEDRLLELYHKGYVKGTMCTSRGNEAVATGVGLPLRPDFDPVAVLHRDFPVHVLMGADPYQLLCQYLANAESPTLAHEGNVHHGAPGRRRFPMISHLGRMLSPIVGATWEARQQGQEAFGLTVIGDGGTSTGEFHEALNVASVLRVPVIFLVENNHYAFSTPTRQQYHARRISDRAAGYGIPGLTIDGTDPWGVYTTVCDLLDGMRKDSLPVLLECMSLRLLGHAAYDKGDYVDPEQMAQWRRCDPLPRTREAVRSMELLSDEELAACEQEIDEEIRETIARAMKVGRPNPRQHSWSVYAHEPAPRVEPFKAARVKNGDAVRRAQDYLLAREPRAYVLGLDVGTYGSAFKTCKGLIDTFGPQRVIDMPICEPAIVGFALGSSQLGGRPIVEFQFADFATEAATQLGLNLGTWYYRSQAAAPTLFRFPCGGGLTMGAFHSGEYEGLWSRFPGLKLLYPATPQETFEALVAGFYDPNPCLVFEHKLLYWSKSGDIDFDGDLEQVWRPRRYTEGDNVTVLALGAMVYEALTAATRLGSGVEVWNPYVLQPLCLDPLLESVQRTGRLLVVQECGQTQGLGDRLISLIAGRLFGSLKCAPRLLSAPDVPVPFAGELEAFTRPNADKIVASIQEMLGEV